MDDGASTASGPPPVMPNVATAQELSAHPLWARSAGRGGRGGNSRARGAAAAEPVQPARFERLSLLAVELQENMHADGVDSDDESTDSRRSVKQRRFRREHDAGSDDLGDESNDETDDGVDIDNDDMNEKGIGGKGIEERLFGRQQEDQGESCDNSSIGSKSPTMRKRDAYKTLFTKKGVTCIGCALAHRIEPVEAFVNDNVGRVSDANLWRMAAIVFKNEVCKPAERDGAETFKWHWKDIASHFKLHTTNSNVGRTAMVQTYAAMRYHVQQRMVRVDGAERELDKGAADLVLKIMAAESKERDRLGIGTSIKRQTKTSQMTEE